MENNTPYFGELIALGTTLSWSIGIFPFTEAARRLGPNSVNHFRLLMAVVFLSILSLLFLPLGIGELFTHPLYQHWIWFGASGVIGLALGDYFSFSSFAILGARVSSIFSTLSPAAALATGAFFIGEHINIIGMIGIAITIAGVIWLTLGKSGKIHLQNNQHGKVGIGILFGILSAVCQGVGVVLANKGFTYQIDHQDLAFFHATWIRMFTATTIIFLFSFSRGQLKKTMEPVFANQHKGNKYALAGTIFGPVIGVSLSMYAISLLHNKPSVAQTIFSLVPILALPLAYLFYKEKISWRSVAGAMIAIFGVILLIWRDLIWDYFQA